MALAEQSRATFPFLRPRPHLERPRAPPSRLSYLTGSLALMVCLLELLVNLHSRPQGTQILTPLLLSVICPTLVKVPGQPYLAWSSSELIKADKGSCASRSRLPFYQTAQELRACLPGLDGLHL